MLRVKEDRIPHCDREAKSDDKQQDSVLGKAQIKGIIKNENSQSLIKKDQVCHPCPRYPINAS